MGRLNTTGLPYLVARPDTGKYTYHRALPREIAPLVAGHIMLTWGTKPHVLSGKPAIKISLKTGDTATARLRWAPVHAQVQSLFDQATLRLRDKAGGDRQGAVPVNGLSREDIDRLANQVHHDILAADDGRWRNPDALSPIEEVLRSLATSAGKTIVPDRARELAQAVERRNAEALLKGRDMRFFDQGIEEAAFEIGPESLETREQLKDGKPVIKDGKPVETVVVGLDPGRPWQNECELDGVVASDVEAILRKNGIHLHSRHPDRNLLALEVLRRKVDALRIVEARQAGAVTPTPPRPDPIVLPKPAGKTISEMRDKWVFLTQPGQKAIDDNRLYVGRFIEIFGDIPIADVTRAMITEFRDALTRCPRNFSKEQKNLSFPEQIKWADACDRGKRLTRRTINAKGIGSIAACLSAAVKDGVISANPCVEVKFSLGKKGKKKYRSYSIDNLNKIFKSEIYTKKEKRWVAGCGEAAFWMPLIALLSGARLEEIGQLLLTDIKILWGIPIFDFIDLDDGESDDGQDAGAVKHQKSIKTEDGRREVPIHPILIALGFLDYIAELRAEKAARAFPELSVYRGKLTHNWSKWWARFTDTHVTKDPLKVFHSFRHGFIDRMRNLHIEMYIIKALVGHASDDVTDGYGDAVDLSTRRDAIGKLTYPGLDLSHLRRKASRGGPPGPT